MLAITTSDRLTTADNSTLKRTSSSLPSCLSLLSRPVASCWSMDNTSLFIATSQGIQKYDPNSNSLSEIYSYSNISHMIVKDKGTLLAVSGDKVHFFECALSKISRTIQSHKGDITSISLSNDSSLFASSSSNAVHVHNLTLSSHTVLRGLSLAEQTITTLSFHSHVRTKLLVGIGKQLVVYDTSRPSGPAKTIPLSEAATGTINNVVSSPFSRTLVAVSTTGGYVSLIDLDKEKGLFRTMNVKVPLTSLLFSAEGASLYLGTENGKLIIVDLRALDKTPRTIVVSESGSRVETISVQKKSKSDNVTRSPSGSSQKAIDSGRTLSAPTTRTRTVSKATPPKVTKTVSSPSHRANAKPTASTPRRSKAHAKVFSPGRDPLENSLSNNEISVSPNSITIPKSNLKASQKTTPIRARKSDGATASPKVSPILKRGPPLPIRTVSHNTARTSSAASSRTKFPTTSLSPTSRTTPPIHPTGRTRSVSSVSKAGPERVSVSHASKASKTSELAPRQPLATRPRIDSQNLNTGVSRTPSPELSSIPISANPVTPLPLKRKAMGALGLGTPTVSKWVDTGDAKENIDLDKKRKGKSVEFQDDDSDGSESDEMFKKDQSMSMAITPQRSPWAPSPLRQMPHSPAGGKSAQDFLRDIIRDIMYDYQQETKADITGLHLDMLRMSRGWKKDVHEMMQEYMGDLHELREENIRLREENERLRRGY